MRLISVLCLLLLALACGNESSSNKVSRSKKLCNLNGQMVPCETMSETSDGQGIDLLDALIDVPIRVTGSQMTFLDSKMDTESGRRISCAASVATGDVYQFSVDGDTLNLNTKEGSFTYTRTSGSGLNGNWVWSGYVDQGTHVIKQLIVINESRAILKTHCEL